ncbi:DUF4139 domain-containing protein [Myxococcaceae bacterium GXIMD 01537]
METLIHLPVVKVTVLEDRALVERRAQVSLPAGTRRVRVEGVSPLAVDRSLQAHVTGGTVAQARLHRAWTDEKPDAWLQRRGELGQRVESLTAELRRTQADVQRLQARLALAQAAREDVLRAISESSGAGQAAPHAWGEQLARAREALHATEESLRGARREEAQAQRRVAEASGALNQNAPRETKLRGSAWLDVEHPGGPATVRLTYLVPCAVWRPAYRATLAPAEGGEAVTLECEAVVWQRTEEDWKDVELCFSTARPTLGASPPRLEEDRLRLREKTDREKQVIEVAVREEALQTTGEGSARQVETMPGLDDGGEALTLAAAHRCDVPSDGAPHRVPLFRFQSPATSELVGYPEHSPLVHRVARFENRGPAVLLAGPVDLVRTSGYVGRAQLRFTARGERLKLGFGSEDTLRVAREVDTDEDTAWVTGRKTRKHRVTLYVSNTGNRAESVALEERIPVSEVEAVEVKVLKEVTKPAPAKVSEDGIVRFELNPGARSQQELVLAYTVSSSSKVAGL